MKERKLWIVIFFSLFLLTGCSQEKLKIVLHTGLAGEEVFRIEHIKCTMPEIMVYLANSRCRYEKVYGEEIWETNLEGVTLEESIKEMVLAHVSQIKAMNLLAEQEGVTLTEEEEKKVEEAAKAYYDLLSEKERKILAVDKEIIRNLYREYAIANKIYYYLIKDVNPEVSDDEARTITVDHILIKTYSLDEQGNKIEYGKEEKKAAYNRAMEVWQKSQEGVSFDTLIATYNEDSQSQYSFGKGEMNLGFETAAFNLGKGEISEIVETEYGYHLIKCITTFNQEETDANKIKIVEKKRDEVFGQRYASFASKLTKALNKELWEKITVFGEEELDTEEFFKIYDEYLANEFSKEWYQE